MKSLVIYFSRADENYAVGVVKKGNTEYIAEFIKEATGADIFKVERKIPYPANYKECCDEALIEQRNREKPELKYKLNNISDYDIIYIGSPIYRGTMPQPMFACLESLDFTGKIIKPFTTHEGSGLGRVVSDLKDICKGAEIKSGLAIQGSIAKTSKDKVLSRLND